MHISDFTYELPDDKVALYPPKIRGTSHLLVLDKETGATTNKRYTDFIDYIDAGDVIVLNNTKVIKARLIGLQDGKTREFLLLERHAHVLDHHHWKVLYRGKIRVGENYRVGTTTVVVEEVHSDGIATISCQEDLLSLADRYGDVPLPPYIKRSSTKEDQQRYQTEFARIAGSVAAPTASLNFTSELIQACRSKDARVIYLTLHVGLGTFLPIRTDEIEQHKMHSEYFEIPADTVNAIHKAKKLGNKVFAVGTTVTRTLEYAHKQILNPALTKSDLSGEADIFIYPGYQFKVVDGLLTNFHAPKTTVLMLAAAFAGWENLLNAYQTAINDDYKFLSYGDSMLII